MNEGGLSLNNLYVCYFKHNSPLCIFPPVELLFGPCYEISLFVENWLIISLNRYCLPINRFSALFLAECFLIDDLLSIIVDVLLQFRQLSEREMQLRIFNLKKSSKCDVFLWEAQKWLTREYKVEIVTQYHPRYAFRVLNIKCCAITTTGT
jgi:hypothetical protein